MNFNRIDTIQAAILFIIMPIIMSMSAQDFLMLLIIMPLLVVTIFGIMVNN